MKRIGSISTYIKKNPLFLLLFIIALSFLFLRTYQFEERAVFAWDQVDTAWNAKNIIINKQLPILGMPAKQNTGIFMGPFYYYFVAFFYSLTNLDPIASPIVALVSSIITFCVLVFITKKLFSLEVALLASFIYSFSFSFITADRVQWPVNFIGPISLTIFYCLYKIMMREVKYLLLLGFTLGFSFHIHFTSVFYFPIILSSLPFFPWKVKHLKIYLSSLALFTLWIVPIVTATLYAKNKSTNNLLQFFQHNYHGFHLRRLLQIMPDAFIEFEKIIFFSFLKALKFIFLPLFIIIYYLKNKKDSFKISYLFVIWFLVPWVLFSVYRGDISDYYFTMTSLQAIIIVSWLISFLFKTNIRVVQIVVILILSGYLYSNLTLYFLQNENNLAFYKKKIKKEVDAGIHHTFTYGAADSYLDYYYWRKKNGSK